MKFELSSGSERFNALYPCLSGARGIFHNQYRENAHCCRHDRRQRFALVGAKPPFPSVANTLARFVLASVMTLGPLLVPRAPRAR
jgi:hypothetical protein